MMDNKVLTLRSGLKLLYASEKLFCEELANRNLPTLNSSSDLEAGIYEGGLKIWECAIDLCNFLDQACAVSFDGLNILELGCGAALPSILTLIKGANSVTLQDFNDFVLEAFTKQNFQLNNQMDPSKCTFIAAEWSKLMDEIGPKIKFDLILTSETIYNEANYLQLVETMDSLLAPHGKIFLAAKSYYFGVGGSIPSFVDFVRKQGAFSTIAEVWTTTQSSVPRKILQLSR